MKVLSASSDDALRAASMIIRGETGITYRCTGVSNQRADWYVLCNKSSNNRKASPTSSASNKGTEIGELC